MSQRFAIIGVGCRFPGSSNSPEEFYNNLVSGKDCVVDIPPERWNKNFFQSDNKEEPGKMIVKRGGFMDHFFEFDNQAFQMSKKEASNIDPQQKILLEVALQTFEDANIEYRGTNTAVFVGSGQVGFAKLATSDPHTVNQYTASGSSLAIQSNLVSYKFDLRGPSMVIDTACSSSGTAMYLALNALKNKDCDQALVGGINMLLNHSMTIAFSKLGVLSPDGKCKSFDERADGYVRSEGAGFVLVKPLEAAIRDGNHIYCEVVHCVANEDGALSPSLTMPSAEAQELAMRRALEEASIQPDDVYYVEAHATGTVLGDSTEVNTIGRVFGEKRRQGNMLRLGSVKSSIGHCECSSFMASLIKCCLMMDRSTLLPSIHFEKPNPKIEFERYNMKVQTAVEAMENSTEKIFSISSFGFGGANVCCLLRSVSPILETSSRPAIPTSEYPELQPFIIRAQSKEAVEARIQDIINYSSDSVDQRRLAHTLQSMRSSFKFMSYGFGTDIKNAKFSAPSRIDSERKPLCLVFSGQGPQHAQMCREMYRTIPHIRNYINHLDELYKQRTGISVVHDWKMFQDKETCSEDLVQRIEVTLPTLLFAQLSIFELWRSMGLKPDVVIGHSFGELTAIYASGAISLTDVISLTAARASLMLKLDNQGTMCALGCGADFANEMITRLNCTEAWIAAYNSPTAVTVGGTHECIDKLVAEATRLKIFARKLSVTNAYHTPLLQPLRKIAHEEFASCVVTTLGSPKEAIVSSVTGKLYTANFTPEYFWSNIENAVQFHQGIEAVKQLLACEPIFLEISPHPVLAMSMKQIGCEHVLPSIIRNKPELNVFYESACKLMINGYNLDFSVFTGNHQRIRDLPPYPFQRRRCFAENIFHRDERLVQERNGNISPLLGRQLHTIDEIWMQQLNAKTLDWISDHVVQNNIIFPGAGYVEIALQALQTSQLSAFKIHKAMSVKEDAFRLVQTRVKDNCAQIYSSEDGYTWTLHAEANKTASTGKINTIVPLTDVQARCKRKVDHLYNRFALLDLNYGPHFQLLQEVFEGEEEAIGVFSTEILTGLNRYIMHPSIIDNCFQCFLCCKQNLSRTYLPVQVGEINVLHPQHEDIIDNTPKYVHCKLNYVDEISLLGDAVAYNASGEPIFTITGFECRAMPKASSGSEKELFTLQWQSKQFPSIPTSTIESCPESELATTMLQKSLSYIKSIDTSANIHPAKANWWTLCKEMLETHSAIITEQATEAIELVDRIGENLKTFLSTDNFDTTSIDLELNEPLLNATNVVSQHIENIITQDSFRNRIVRIQCPSEWLAKEIMGSIQATNIDWIQNATDNHADIIVTFNGKDAPLTSVSNAVFIQIQPTRNSFHVFAYPHEYGQLSSLPEGKGPYIVNMSQSSSPSNLPSREYSEIVTYTEADSIGLLNIVQSLDPEQAILIILVCHTESIPESSTLIGFGRVIANEYKNWDVKIIDCPLESTALWVDRVKQSPLSFEHEVKIVEGEMHVPRLVPVSTCSSSSNNSNLGGFHLHVAQPGLLNSLEWHAIENNDINETPIEPNQVLVQVMASSLNFKDMMLAQGMLKGLEDSIKLGIEFSGVIRKIGSSVQNFTVGDEVFGFGDQCLASHVITSQHLIAKKPANLTHIESTSIPAVFVTSYFGLVYKGGLSEDQTILIHSAAGGVGQASIQIAKWKKASKILATVGSQSKRDFLQNTYGITTFANSHHTEWPQEFAEQGVPEVDLVLNSLSGKHIELGIKMLSPYGSFVEIGKRDILDNNAIHLRPFLENLSFHSVHLDRMISGREQLVGRLLKEISALFEAGHFQPNVDRVFAPNEIEAAFRYMQSGQHLGKIIVSMESTPAVIHPKINHLSAHKTYILSGGLGAVGFEIAKWMIQSGANDVVLLSRSAKPSPQQQIHLDASNGRIRTAKVDVTNENDVKNLFTNLITQPVGGIVHLAMYLDDDRISKLNAKRFEDVLRPKIDGAKNLINHCPNAQDLDFVIFFSSISAIIGNPEQANYAAGNGFLDSYTYHLRRQNINACVLNLGTVEDVGVIAQDYTLRRLLISRGLLKEATSVKEICHYFMPHLIHATTAQLVPEIDLSDVCENHPSLRPVFGLLANKSSEESEEGNSDGAELNEEVFKNVVAQLLQMNAADVDMGEKLINYGVDSLLAVEMSTIFTKKYNKNVSQMDILGGITGNQLMKK